MTPSPADALATQVRYLIGEVLAAHDSRVREADERLADAERGIQDALAQYDALPWPERRLSERLGHAESVARWHRAARERLDHDLPYLLALAARELLDARSGRTHTP